MPVGNLVLAGAILFSGSNPKTKPSTEAGAAKGTSTTGKTNTNTNLTTQTYICGKIQICSYDLFTGNQLVVNEKL
ncbi:Hypothetical predicted protein [Mytilus galloprovincialis]|uniref:Uncharacterized protein n=1 Tax=Mytilus galloprovincialis TaxID=29158 RepID=A0A8B6FH38_MYTGA|nr:Hypothetical predicted protein [Mytilus galloprovincialis]